MNVTILHCMLLITNNRGLRYNNIALLILVQSTRTAHYSALHRIFVYASVVLIAKPSRLHTISMLAVFTINNVINKLFYIPNPRRLCQSA